MAADQETLSDAQIAARLASLRHRLPNLDAERRREAVNGIYELCMAAGSRAAAAIPVLVGCLRDPDEKVADSAAWGLKYCSPASIEALIDCLPDPKASVRARACTALGRIGPDALPACRSLRALLGDAHAGVRDQAAWALGLIRDTTPETLNLLLAMSDARLAADRAAALHALGNIGRALSDPAILQAEQRKILRALKDDDENVRWSAFHVLESLQLPGDERARLLMQLLRTEKAGRVRSAVLDQLKTLVPTVDLTAHVQGLAELVDRRVPEARQICECFTLMGSKASVAEPSLLKALRGETSLAIAAAEALWKITGRADALVPVLADSFDKDPDGVCDLISVIGAPAAPLIDKVISALQAEDWDLQWAAADALGAICADNPEVITALTNALWHASPIVKSSAARGLSKVGAPALAAVTSIVSDKTDPRSEWAADAIGQMGHRAAGAATVLRQALRDPRQTVRTWCAIALGKVAGDPAVVSTLSALVADFDRPDLQREAAIALATIGPAAREALEALEAAAESDDPDVQRAAAEAIRAVRGTTH